MYLWLIPTLVVVASGLQINRDAQGKDFTKAGRVPSLKGPAVTGS